MVRHPTKRELLTYTEGLIDGNVHAAIARHVSGCQPCRNEVAEIRHSLELVEKSKAPKPSDELSRKILIEARKARPRRTRFQRTAYRAFAVAKGAAFVAGLVAVCAVWFTVSVMTPQAQATSRTALNAAETTGRLKPDELYRATAEIETLADAVASRGVNASNRRERHYARRLMNVNAQLSAAHAALERNPASPRAIRLVDDGLRHQREALITLIRERSL
jgi:hypothetical protein